MTYLLLFLIYVSFQQYEHQQRVLAVLSIYVALLAA
jgi:hypothetical protein